MVVYYLNGRNQYVQFVAGDGQIFKPYHWMFALISVKWEGLGDDGYIYCVLILIAPAFKPVTNILFNYALVSGNHDKLAFHWRLHTTSKK